MKLRLLTVLHLGCDAIERGLSAAGRYSLRPLQRLREWAWHRAALENLRTCNVRPASRETF